MDDVQAVFPQVVSAEDQARYAEEEDDLLGKISLSVDYLQGQVEWAGKWHRRMSVATMVLSVLAPIFVTGSVAGGSQLIPASVVGPASILLTLSLAIIEGFRRIYKFGDQWSSAYAAKSTVRRAKNAYKFDRIGLAIGSDQWKQKFNKLKAAYEAAGDTQTADFFKTTLQPTNDQLPIVK